MRAVELLVGAALLVLPVPAGATERSAGTNVVVEETVRDDLAAAGSSVLIQGRVEGDVLAAGSSVTVAGPVTGDVLAAGASVSVRSAVGDDLRAAGASVLLAGPVADNISLAGSSVVLARGARVGRDADLAGSDVQVLAPVGRNLSLAADRAQLAAEVGGSVFVSGGRVTLRPGAVVRGDLVVRSDHPPEISREARVLGRVEHRPRARAGRAGRDGRPWAGWAAAWLLGFFWLTVLGTAALALSRNRMEAIAEAGSQRPGRSAGVGCLALVLIPALCAALLVTLVALPLGLVLLALYFALLIAAGALAAYAAGTWLERRTGRTGRSPYLRMALGALIVSLLSSLPVVGFFFWIAFLALGLGAYLTDRREQYLRRRAAGPA